MSTQLDLWSDSCESFHDQQHDLSTSKEGGEPSSCPTLMEFIERTYLPYARANKKSWQTDVSLLRTHLLPQFGPVMMSEVSKLQVAEFVSRLRATKKPSTVNRILILFRFIYNQAIRWEVPGLTHNPTAACPLLRDNARKERFLSKEETARLYDSVCESESPVLRHVIALLILTGARKGEALTARWTDFDLAHRIWRVPMSKSGRPRHIPLSDGALAVLERIPNQGLADGYLFPSPSTGKPYTSIFGAWDRARQRAKLQDVRIHDLRHSFASMLVNQGRSLYEVQQILGHHQIKTTQRYAHLANKTLIDAANTASSEFSEALGVAPAFAKPFE